MKKKILFIYPEMMIGGSTTSLLSLLNTIDYKKYEIDLILYKNRGEFLNDIPKQVKLLPHAYKYDNSISSKIRKIFRLIFNRHLYRSIFCELKYNKRLGFNNQVFAYAQIGFCKKVNKNYDAAIGFLELWSNIYLTECVKAKKKIAWIHVDYEKAHYIPELDVGNLEKVDNVVCVSNNCLDNFKASFPSLKEKSLYIENILSSAYIKKKADGEYLYDKISYNRLKIITVCRLDMLTKGIDRILNAAKKLKDEGYEFRWYIVGDGPDKDMITLMAEKNNVGDRVILLGKLTNPYTVYKQCDVYVMPSRNEGKPMSVTEAQILGLPCIVTNYSSAQEQIKNGVNGIIVKNDDESIYFGVKRILDNPEILNMFKSQLKQENLSNEYVIEHFYKLLDY